MRGSALASAALIAATASARCQSGLFTIVVRGTGEPQGVGVTGILADGIARQVPGSQVEPLPYPATLSDPAYQKSVAAGVLSVQNTMRQHLKACPESRVAIMGYSQGAHVAMDALCGGLGMAGFQNSTPLASSLIKKNVVAIVLFGDPSHVVNATYDRGTSVHAGIFQRSNDSVRVCEAYADRIASYCDAGDVYCDRGTNSTVHSLYFSRYGDEAVRFVVDRYRNETEKGDGSGGGNSTSTAATATGTAKATATATTMATATASAGGGGGGGGGRVGNTSGAAAAAGRFGEGGVYYAALALAALVGMQAL